MHYKVEQFTNHNLDEVYSLIVNTVEKCYFEYYPREAVDFFISYHNKEAIISEGNNTIILKDGNKIVATGTLIDTEIKRVFVLPQYQGKGYGRIIMNSLEKKAKNGGYKITELHSSLFAKKFYDKLGYKMFKIGKTEVKNNEILYFQRMAKSLIHTDYDKTLVFNDKKFTVIKNEGQDAEVNRDTIFHFYQQNGILYAEYTGGNIKYGEMFGAIENDRVTFYYKQENMAGLSKKGTSEAKIIKLPENKIRLIDEWKWSSQEGKGSCVLEEV